MKVQHIAPVSVFPPLQSGRPVAFRQKLAMEHLTHRGLRSNIALSYIHPVGAMLSLGQPEDTFLQDGSVLGRQREDAWPELFASHGSKLRRFA